MFVFALASVAFAGEIQVQTGGPVMVSVDGQILEYPEGSTTVVAKDLAGGQHHVEVRNLFGKFITDMQVEVPVDEQVRLSYRKKQLTRVGSGKLPEPAPTVIVHAPAAPAPTQASNHGISASVSAGDTSFSASVNIHGDPAVAPAPGAAVPHVATPQTVSSLRRALADASFSKDRLEILETAATNNWFTVAQVATLLGPFDFDNKRLEGAEILATRVVDPENAHQLSDAFEFSSNARKAQALFR